MFKYYIYKLGSFLSNHLPLHLSYKLAIFISDVQYFLSFRDRRAVKSNLRVILSPDVNLSKAARAVFRNFGKYINEFFWMAKHLNKEYIDQHVKLKNYHHVENVLKSGKGGVLITAHLGNWEMGAVIVSKLGHSVTVVALPHKERDVNTFFNKQRESRGMTIVPTSTAIRQCLETLRENKFTALAADRDFSLNGEVMDFLGRKAFIPKGPAAFSIKTGAPIVPVFLIRQESNNFVLHFEEPIWPGENGNEHNAQLNLMYKYVRIMEDKIRQNPEQWMVFREFWVDENKYFYSSNKEQNDQ